MAKRKTEERKSGRRAAWDRDRKEKEGGGFLQRRGFLVGADKLDDLGISEFRSQSGEEGAWAVNKVHILPSNPEDCEENMDLIAFKIYAHYDVGANGESFLCPQWMKQWFERSNIAVPEAIAEGKCPVCEEHGRVLAHYKKVRNAVSDEERNVLWKEMSAMRPYSGSYKNPKPKRYFLWVMDGTDEDTEAEGIKFFFMPVSVYEEGVLDVSEGDDEDGFVDIADPKGGRVFQFKRQGKGREDTKYTGYRLKKVDYTVEDWCKDVPRYFDVLQFHGYDEIAEAFSAGATSEADKEPDKEPEDEPDEESDDKRPEKRRRRKTMVEEAFEDVEDEDKEEKPKRRRKRAETKDDDNDSSDDVKKIRERRRKRNEENADEDA